METQTRTKTPSPSRSDVLSGIRVKSASERFPDERWPAKHVKSGLPVLDMHGREVSLPSELSNARAGVLLKVLAQRAGVPILQEEWERDLWGEMPEKSTWAGQVNGAWHDDVDGIVTKTILDDTTSGGLEVVPVEFDADVVTYPLLNGELFPQRRSEARQPRAAHGGRGDQQPHAHLGHGRGDGVGRV